MCGAARRAARRREAGRDAGLTQGAQQGEGAARATRRARPRMVAKQPARSVTPTAPRASSTLNAWLSRSSWPYAGIGSRASSSRPASCAQARSKPYTGHGTLHRACRAQNTGIAPCRLSSPSWLKQAFNLARLGTPKGARRVPCHCSLVHTPGLALRS